MPIIFRIILIAVLTVGPIAMASCKDNRSDSTSGIINNPKSAFSFINHMINGSPFDIASLEKVTHIPLHVKESTQRYLVYEGLSHDGVGFIDKIEVDIWRNSNKRISSFYINKGTCISFDHIKAKYGRPTSSHLPLPPAPGNSVSQSPPANWGIGYKRNDIMVDFEFSEWLQTNPNPCAYEIGFITLGKNESK